jgi:hypothetical protein
MDPDDECLLEMDSDYAMASGSNIIWLSIPSKKWLVHEFLHIVGWKFKLPILWHRIIHKIFS